MVENFPTGSKYMQAYPRYGNLAQLLYNIYVADIPTRPGIEMSLFADDTAAFTSINNINYAVKNLQQDMSHLES
jgi:hypothetical protein